MEAGRKEEVCFKDKEEEEEEEGKRKQRTRYKRRKTAWSPLLSSPLGLRLRAGEGDCAKFFPTIALFCSGHKHTFTLLLPKGGREGEEGKRRGEEGARQRKKKGGRRKEGEGN